MAAYETTGEPRYRDRATAWAEANRWSLGPRLRHADDQCAGQTYLELYGLEPIPERLEPTQRVLEAMIAGPRPGRVDWSWCDALFMAPPVFARMGAATDDGRYFDRMSAMWWDTTDYLFDTDYGLFYRDASFFNRRCPNGEKMFWSRGNGWVMAGTVRVLEYLPADHPDRNRFIELLRTMAASVASLQKKDGFWPSCLTDPENYPWPETSGTAAFCYGLAWGINQGFLEADTYRPVVQNAWNALVGAVDADGKLGWVQPVGSQPGPSRASDSRPYGVGLFLLAASEVFKLGVKADLPPQVVVPNASWTWFNDPRALFHRGRLYIGYVRSDGKTALSAYDVESGTHTTLWTSSLTAVDDHNNPGLAVLPDGRLIAFYSRHNTDRFFKYRISKNADPATPADWDADEYLAAC